MADWACFVDEPDYHDPEVAVADGYADIPLPPGALSMIALAPELLSVMPRGPLLRRSWRAARPIVVGEHLALSVSVTDEAVIGEFHGDGGEPVAWEMISGADGRLGEERGTSVFRTGCIDSSRRRALAWSVSQLRPEGSWPWKDAPDGLVDLCWSLVGPSVVAARAAVPGPDAPRRVRSIDVTANGSIAGSDAMLVAELVGSGSGRADFSILAADQPVARVTVDMEV